VRGCLSISEGRPKVQLAHPIEWFVVGPANPYRSLERRVVDLRGLERIVVRNELLAELTWVARQVVASTYRLLAVGPD